ncbi:short-chain dehydrogenase/reductase-like protein [Nemania abortiva]|nr:short-chain dehydrogenase/reductase-like protein [Nemania abortiva]
MNPQGTYLRHVLPLLPPQADFTGKTVIVTGANTGLGREAVRHFAQLNAKKVILGCRDLKKAQAAKEDIEATVTDKQCELETWEVNLESFDSVRAFCNRASTLDRLDIVVENAGLLSQKYHVAEGYERLCTVNVISTWLMALLLLPTLRKTQVEFYRETGEPAMPHLCIVGSNAQFYTKFEQRNEPSIFEALRGSQDIYNRYANTKLISLLVMREVAERMRVSDGDGEISVVLNMVEPGFCKSELLRERSWPWYFKLMMAISIPLLARTPEMGARTYIWAASAGSKSHGNYIEDCELSTPAPFADTEEGRRLQVKVFDELSGILDSIVPGIIKCI